MRPVFSASPAPAYRPDVDGLRAVSIIAVVLFHARWGATGGFVGVDVFFVISGFLIGSLLLAEARTGRIDLVAFWERRARRIVPALALMLFATAVIGAFVLLPDDYASFGLSLAAQAVFLSNRYFAIHAGYFQPENISLPLMHTWSLAVEGQFYLIFPVVLLALLRLPRRLVAPASIAICALSLLYSVHAVAHGGREPYYSTLARVWELGLGVLLAGCPPLRLPALLREALGVAGLGLIVFAVVSFGARTPFPGLAALIPCGGAACIVLVGGSGSTVVGRLLALRPMVYLGKLSYSLYLWHWPAFAFVSYTRLSAPSVPLKAAAYLAAFVAAVLSWKFVETPLRTRAWVASRERYWFFTGATLATVVVLGLTICGLHGLPTRLPASVAQYAAGHSDWVPAFRRDVPLAEAQQGDFTPLGAPDAGQPVDYFVWGDSHAMMLLPVLDELGRAHARRGCAAVRNGTPPLLGPATDADVPDLADTLAFNQAVVAYLRSRRIADVILIARWDNPELYFTSSTPEYRAALERTLAVLHELGARVWVVADVPQLPWHDPPRLLARTALGNGDFAAVSVPAAPYLRQVSQQIQRFSPLLSDGDHLLDPSNYFVRDRSLVIANDGWSLFSDGDHVSRHGAMRLRPMFAPIFAR